MLRTDSGLGGFWGVPCVECGGQKPPWGRGRASELRPVLGGPWWSSTTRRPSLVCRSHVCCAVASLPRLPGQLLSCSPGAWPVLGGDCHVHLVPLSQHSS